MPLKRTESLLYLPSHSTSDSPQCYPALSLYKEQRLRRRQSSCDQLTIRIHNTRRSSPPPSPCPLPPLPPIPPPQPPTRGRPRTPTPPSKVILPSIASPLTTILTPRTSSPLSPKRVPLPGRPVFPRTKNPEPDLYRLAIRMSMLLTPAGQKILSLGPRVAMQLEVERKVDMQMHFDLESHSIRNLDDERSTRDIISVTKDLERMVEDISDDDVLMDSFIPTTPTTAQPAPPVVTPSWVLVKGEDWEMIDCTV